MRTVTRAAKAADRTRRKSEVVLHALSRRKHRKRMAHDLHTKSGIRAAPRCIHKICEGSRNPDRTETQSFTHVSQDRDCLPQELTLKKQSKLGKRHNEVLQFVESTQYVFFDHKASAGGAEKPFQLSMAITKNNIRKENGVNSTHEKEYIAEDNI